MKNLELFLYKDVEQILENVEVFPVYLPEEYIVYEELMKELIKGKDVHKIPIKLTYLGDRMKECFPMVIDFCIDEESRLGRKPWIYLSNIDLDIDFFRFQLAEIFKKTTTQLLSLNNGSEESLASNSEVEKMIGFLIKSIYKINYGEKMNIDNIKDNKRLVCGLVTDKIAELGQIPIEIELTNGGKILRNMKFYSAFENSRHVLISEWFNNSGSDKKVNMNSFVISFTVVEKLEEKYLSIKISRRTWIDKPISKNVYNRDISLYSFTKKKYVSKQMLTYKGKPSKITFKSKLDEKNFDLKYKDLSISIQCIVNEPNKYAFIEQNQLYGWGIPYDVQRDFNTKKRGVAVIERQAFKRIFEKTLGLKPVERLEMNVKNKKIKISNKIKMDYINVGGVDKLELQIWGTEELYETICDTIEIDSLEYEKSVNIKDIIKSDGNIYFKRIEFNPSERAESIIDEKKKKRWLKDEKKYYLKHAIEELIKLKNINSNFNICLECIYGNDIMFTLLIDKENAKKCLFNGDEDIESIIKAFKISIFSKVKIKSRKLDECILEVLLKDKTITINIMAKTNGNFAYKIDKDGLLKHQYSIGRDVESNIQEPQNRMAAIIQLEDLEGKDCDPKNLIRYVFGDKNIKTQFITPEVDNLKDRIRACFLDVLFKEGIINYEEILNDIEIYSYIEKKIKIHKIHTPLRNDTESKSKYVSITIPILGKLSSKGMYFKILDVEQNWISCEHILTYINNYIDKKRNIIVNKNKKTRLCDIDKIVNEINNIKNEQFKQIAIISDLYLKDYGEINTPQDTLLNAHNIMNKNNINMIIVSTSSVVPEYITTSDEKVGQNKGYSIWESTDKQYNELAYIVSDKLNTAINNMNNASLEKDKMYSQRILKEIKCLGERDFIEIVEIYQALLTMTLTFNNMTNLDVLSHYIQKLTEYIDSIEYRYAYLHKLI